MQFDDVVRTTGTVRYYKPDPVPTALLARVLDAARWAPSGGNRQPLRFIVVRDTVKKRQLAELYLPIWERYVAGVRQGAVRVGARAGTIEHADHFARHLADIPVLLLVLARLADVHPTDRDLGRLSVVGGASIYPAVQNVLLAARNVGLGTALTTLHAAVEPELKPMFDIPDDISVVAMVTLGWPARDFPRELTRRPLSEMVFADRYGVALEAPSP
ncbi:MAG: nitroreductase family protein [Gammaproteobacteria bacterium]|nr:nitroreductase family protein [Gammaproteobacteria bacterium]